MTRCCAKLVDARLVDARLVDARLVDARLVDARLVCIRLAIAAVVALGGGASMAPARSAPPTVTPSPGYDARLQEQRAARTMYEPFAPHSKPGFRRRAKRVHRGGY